MKENSTSTTYEHLGEHYRVTHYFGSNVMRIERLISVGILFKADMYETIYFGHADPIEWAVQFSRSAHN